MKTIIGQGQKWIKVFDKMDDMHVGDEAYQIDFCGTP